MKPSIGRTVIYVQPQDEHPVNGTREHPAVVTRVQNPGVETPYCNLQVLFDAGSVTPRTSVPQFNAEAAEAGGWKWPDRV